ncbi:MAG: CocE/NonD family hydrolase [Pseudomonadota bacterium]
MVLSSRCTAFKLIFALLLMMCGFLLSSGALADDDTVFGGSRSEALQVLKSAHRETQFRVPMRDGVMLNTDVIFPDGPAKNLPTVLIRTPYRFDKEEGARSVLLARFLEEGYAIVFNHERGRYYSEGTFSFLNGAFDDGYDIVDWIASQEWSNGRVGTIGCSSSAENQLGLAVADHPAHRAMIPIAPGAGIGDIGPYKEQGNFYRGGAWQGLWLAWYYAHGRRFKPDLPANMTQAERQQFARYFNFDPVLPEVDFAEAIRRLPLQHIPASVDMLPSDLQDFIKRHPNDPSWDDQPFVREGDRFGVPTLWVFSWYDIATPVNIAYVNHQRKNAKTKIDRDNQFMVISPVTHCKNGKETKETYVGDRFVGDARFEYMELFVDWFDYWLKDKKNGVTARRKNDVFLMGKNKWRSFDTWPPQASQPVKLYLSAAQGDTVQTTEEGALRLEHQAGVQKDTFTYDPKNPVPSKGGSICCFKGLVGGAFDQSDIEERDDVLVYTTPPFKKGVSVTGHIDVNLYVSSDAPDTDITVKLVVVDGEGVPYNLDDNIQRLRYRDGYDEPAFMEEGKVYKVSVGPLATSNYFAPGERLRIEISSSNFPRYGRNLNTGGNNYDEDEPVIARNSVHFSGIHPSHIVLPVEGDVEF